MYYSKDPTVEQHFEQEIATKVTKVKPLGKTSRFLGIKFQWIQHADGNLTCKLSQEAFADNLIETTELDSDAINHPPTPYQSGLPIDAIYDSPPEDSVECKIIET
eukprot:13099282-Ditylum_brightwellii.AAC.1